MVSTLLQCASCRLDESARRVGRSVAALIRPEEPSRFFPGRSVLLDQILGLVILGALAVVISVYVPLYQKVIAAVLDVPRATSRSLAIALITFAALSGVLLELSGKLLWPSGEARWPRRLVKGGIAVAVSALMLGCTVALCLVNTLVYATFYERQAPAISLAFAGAALLMSVVEMVGFFVGIHLGFGMLVWLVVSVVARLPLITAAALLDLLRGLVTAGGHAEPPRTDAGREPRPDRRSVPAGGLLEANGPRPLACPRSRSNVEGR